MNSRHPSPPLLEDEWVLLLDVYLSYRSSSLPATHPAIIDASKSLIAMAQKAHRKIPPNFRLPEGIRRQIGAFRHLDKTRSTNDKKAAARATLVWNRFSNDPAGCRLAADAIRTEVA